MNIFSIINLLNVFLLIKTEYETIELKLEENDFYIPIKLGKNTEEEYFLLSTMLPINFFPSSECSICKHYHINEKNTEEYTFIHSNVSLLYYYLNFSGDMYRTNIILGSQTYSNEFLAVKNIYDIDSYNGKGRYSLSFLNYEFNTTNKTFAIYLNSENGELHLGGFDNNKIEEEKLRIFNISKTNNSSPFLYNDFWFINFNYFYIKDIKFKSPSFKLTFDLNTDYFHIPKDLFFALSYLIFPEQGRCQVQPEGHFVCFCNEEYAKYFASFKFMNENNETIEINPEDYILYDNSGADNYCYVYLMLNYENDFFIAGKYVMGNYYNIFDIENEQLKLYKIKKDDNEFLRERNFIISLVLLLSGIFLFLFCYFIYRKYFSNNQINEEENFDENYYGDININENVNENDLNNNEQNNERINEENGENKENYNNLSNDENNENNVNNDDENEIVFDGRESNIIN